MGSEGGERQMKGDGGGGSGGDESAAKIEKRDEIHYINPNLFW